MNILNPTSIEEQIVSLLQKNSLTGARLLEEIKKDRPKTTKQAVYVALRVLRSGEIVVKHRKLFSLSSVWIIKMTEFFHMARYFYTKTRTADEGFLSLEDGDRISYTFKNPNIADIFWGHAFDILSEVTLLTEPVYVYNPHEWFLHARHDSEKAIFDRITKTGKQVLVIGGGNTSLDKSLTKEFDGKISQYYPTDEVIFEKRNYYLNIFDDFIIEAWIDENVAKKIDIFYQTTSTWNEDSKSVLKKIIETEGKNKLTISRNKRRADKLKKVFKKYFHIHK